MIAFAVGLKLHGLRVDHCTMFQRLCAVFNSSAPVFVVKSQKLGDFSVFGDDWRCHVARPQWRRKLCLQWLPWLFIEGI